ncbi:MAG: glycosyltransferase family 2 protein [Pseudomonadota bacterium]
MPPRVTIIVPTFRRVGPLSDAVRSLFAQSALDRIRPSLIIVDNDPQGSALATANALSAKAPGALQTKVIHCKQAGVANARNAALDCVDTPLVAFVDDDQTAPETWLEELLKAYEASRAAVTFGPVDAVLPVDVKVHRAFFETFFSRRPGHNTGLIPEFYGCGNALLDLGQLPKRAPLFDPKMNEVGGEDDLLFMHAERAGCTFGWAENARVWEHVPTQRARLKYTLTRAIAYGQGPTRKAEASRKYPELLFWIGVGTSQFAVYSILAGLGWLTGAPQRAAWLDKAARGLGKVIWRWKLKFYGQSQLPAPNHSNPATGRAGQPQT